MAVLPRAVIYCRCSTEEESQTDALRSQIIESEACVKEQGWLLVDRYVELKSGTTTKGRMQYNRLFDDLLSDRFEIIVIKSQDRLMRNVKDWYLFLDRMLSHGKRLFMYIEGKFYTADDALVTGIKAILAEEYSRELSKKINNAHRGRQKNGGKTMLTSRTFGFLKMPDGSVKIVEEEAEIVRKIYEYCAVGYGSRKIANLFLNQGYVKRTGNPLTATSITRIIRNPLYKGTMVMNKVHYDFETKKTVKVPKEQWIIREGEVPAIVEEELWEQANQAMTHRAGCFQHGKAGQENTGKGQYDLSGKIICSQCKKPYYRTWRHGYGDKNHIVTEWKCSSYLEKGRKKYNGEDRTKRGSGQAGGGCDNIHLNEQILFDVLEQIGRGYLDGKLEDQDTMICHAIRILRKVLADIPVEKERERVEKEEKRLEGQKDILLTKFLEGVISDKDYCKKNEGLEHDIARLKEEKKGLIDREQGMGNWEQRIETIKSRLENGGIKKAVAGWMLENIRQIRVHEWKLEICFDEVPLGGVAIWVDYPFGPETVRGRYLDRRKIVELLRKTPSMNGKLLAENMGRSVYMVRNRMEELIKGGYIRFDGHGRSGRWEILKELPDKRESIRMGGL